MSKLPTEPPHVVVQKMGSYIVRYRGRAFFTFMVYVLSSVMGAVVPLQIGATVDDVVAGKYAQFPWKPVLIILAATVAQAIVMLFGYVQRRPSWRPRNTPSKYRYHQCNSRS